LLLFLEKEEYHSTIALNRAILLSQLVFLGRTMSLGRIRGGLGLGIVFCEAELGFLLLFLEKEEYPIEQEGGLFEDYK
jgi:hypothetical protein